MAQVTRSVTLAASPEEVWAAIGGFQSLADWHPGFASSTREDIGSAEHRRLALADGSELLEKHLGADSASYGYAIVDGPLPISHYRATIAVVPAGSGSAVVWSSIFTAKEPGVEDTIAGVYEAGLAALKERFGG
ncbi:SRPBCC family protein [Paralimibaculum aggregatum]|uniref:SRPBCC family protein n=1 Tax=Paralimibaculum aggregatum TaxID=3036245 RepID=A0ABQ6LFJ8_9RHOB|nr:SRPBCC family protein [Limibaculum sp. NKW23]GMG81176.1 SRPBCC family protein [Limibaculum sp. NKW23]